MKHYVKMPLDNSCCELPAALATFMRDRMIHSAVVQMVPKPDVKAWLDDNTQGDWLVDCRAHITCDHIMGMETGVFHFNNAADAILFKLTWGGDQ